MTMSMIKFCFPLFGLAILSTRLFADVTPNALFAEHAVLQRELPLPVWGKGVGPIGRQCGCDDPGGS